MVELAMGLTIVSVWAIAEYGSRKYHPPKRHRKNSHWRNNNSTGIRRQDGGAIC
jgi:hypothetical protein